MYETYHLDVARQRHQDLLAEAERNRLRNDLRDADGSERLLAVRGVFAGIVAAVSGLGRSKPKPASKPAATPV